MYQHENTFNFLAKKLITDQKSNKMLQSASIEEDKRDLINREIGKFRKTAEADEQKKEKEKDRRKREEKERDRDRTRGSMSPRKDKDKKASSSSSRRRSRSRERSKVSSIESNFNGNLHEQIIMVQMT